MLRNYIKTAWRNIIKNSFYTGINIIGLTIGLSVGLLILLWVQDELSFDRFNTKANCIYKLETVGGLGPSRRMFDVAMAPIAVFAKNELPEVINSARITTNYLTTVYKCNDKVYTVNNAAYADASLFSIFDFKLLEGQQRNPFPDNNSVVLTQTTAVKFFGRNNPVGQVIKNENNVSFKVTGVIKDFPHNSSINYDMFFPMSYFNQLAYNQNKISYNGGAPLANMDADWHILDFETYLLTRPNAPVAQLQTRLRNIHIRNKADDTDVAYLMEPLTRVHLYKADGNDGGIATVRVFMLVAVLILVIACINYVNLSTALSILRAKEVSMRKIIGAGKVQLFIQFITETAAVFVIAAVLALGAIYLLMPWYNRFAGKDMVFSIADYHVWITIIITLVVTLAVSSIYPALLLSSFNPLQALNGRLTSGMGNNFFRKILVTVQFSVSILLITGTFIIGKQLNYIRNKNLGYDKEHVLSFYMGKTGAHYEAFKNELLKDKSVLAVSRSSSNIVDVGAFTGDASWQGMPSNTNIYFHPIAADSSFIPFFKMKMAAGHNFTGSVADSLHFILNEAAIAQMNIKDPIGKTFRMGTINGIITGVVKDFHFTSLRNRIEPAVLTYHPENAGRMYVKTTGSGAAAAMAAVNRVWRSFSKEAPVAAYFLDDEFDSLYRSEQRTGSLFNMFAIVAVIISCLGLLALATYTAQVKTREIGIRKVLGASVATITRMLSWDFLWLVCVAIIIATPIAWYSMYKWLQNFAYRTQLSWWIFILSGLLALIIAFITISLQAVKAAMANPVKSLRSE